MQWIKEEKRETFRKLAEQCSSFPKWKEENIFQKSIMRNVTSNNSAPTGIIFVMSNRYKQTGRSKNEIIKVLGQTVRKKCFINGQYWLGEKYLRGL